jgi:translation initiation factor 2B subunit (eIF-2B alpha/beta/delta family)
MDETHVVTCFLRNQGDVLLLRRSDAVGSYSGLWGTVAGHAEGHPEDQAWTEIAEETGLEDACERVRAGEPFEVVDDECGTRWVVHPFLFDCERRAVEPNEETTDWVWVPPTELLRRETVPELWRSYDAVRPSVESVESDGEHGSAYLSVRALEVLRDEAALAAERGDATDLDALATRLRSSRPGMAALWNRVGRVAGTINEDPAAVEAAAEREIGRALDADADAAANAADLVEGERVVTCSRSGTVREALLAGDPDAVLVTESHPGGEGTEVAESLSESLEVTLASDAAGPRLLGAWDADRLLVGADTVLESAVANKVGTYPLALAAARAGVPVTVVCADDKIAPAGWVFEAGTAPELYDGDAALDVANPLFERLPLELVSAVVTENGALGAKEVKTRAAGRAADE